MRFAHLRRHALSLSVARPAAINRIKHSIGVIWTNALVRVFSLTQPPLCRFRLLWGLGTLTDAQFFHTFSISSSGFSLSSPAHLRAHRVVGPKGSPHTHCFSSSVALVLITRNSFVRSYD